MVTGELEVNVMKGCVCPSGRMGVLAAFFMAGRWLKSAWALAGSAHFGCKEINLPAQIPG